MQAEPWCARCDKPVDSFERLFENHCRKLNAVKAFCHGRVDWIDLPEDDFNAAPLLDRSKLLCFAFEIQPEDLPERFDEIDEEVEARLNE
jgi:hypothetical protein